MVILLFRNSESELQDVSEALARAGIPSDLSMIYARAILAVKEDLERLPQSNALALMETLVKAAQNHPGDALLVSECFQEKLQVVLTELGS